MSHCFNISPVQSYAPFVVFHSYMYSCTYIQIKFPPPNALSLIPYIPLSVLLQSHFHRLLSLSSPFHTLSLPTHALFPPFLPPHFHLPSLSHFCLPSVQPTPFACSAPYFPCNLLSSHSHSPSLTPSPLPPLLPATLTPSLLTTLPPSLPPSHPHSLPPSRRPPSFLSH